MKNLLLIITFLGILNDSIAQSCQSSFDFTNTSNANRSISINASTPENLYSPTTGFTWECWFNLKNINSSQITKPSMMITASDAVFYNDIAIGFNWPHNPTTPGLIFMLSDITGGLRYVLKTNMSFDSNTWYHVAGVCDYNGNKMYLYVNDTMVDSTSINISLSNRVKNVAVSIGNDDRIINPYIDPVPFMGLIDEVRFWNIPRTKNQIISDLNTCLPNTTSNLVAYYKADENTGITSYNHMNSSLYTATLQNNASWGAQKLGLSCCSSSAISQLPSEEKKIWIEKNIDLNEIVFHFESIKNEENLYVKVIDLLGKEVLNIPLSSLNSGNHKVNISNLQNGMYLCYFIQDESTIFKDKFIIVH